MSENNPRLRAEETASINSKRVASWASYYDKLRRIHVRLAVEGYFLPNGWWDIFKAGQPLGEVEEEIN